MGTLRPILSHLIGINYQVINLIRINYQMYSTRPTMNNRHSSHLGNIKGLEVTCQELGIKTDPILYYTIFIYLFINNKHILLCQSFMHITKHTEN